MGKIDKGRVILGGLVAGLVLNIGEYVLNGVILMEEWEAAMADLGLEPMGGSDIMVIVVMTFLLGIFLVWLYAAIRPRFGPGPKAAVVAGFAGWIPVSFFPFIWSSLIDLWPSNLMLISTVWALFELPIGTMAGGWLYKEETAAAPTGL